MKMIILATVLAVVIGLILWRWRRIVSPEWNNRIFLALCVICTILFFNAIYQGGGEPLGTKALRESFAPTPQSKIVERYQAASQYFISGEEKTSERPLQEKNIEEKELTWSWWKIWFVSFLIAVGFIPLAFWDEVRDAWRYAMERAEQRRVVINLRPEPVFEPQQIQGQEQRQAHLPFEPLTWGQRFRERFVAVVSANTLMEFMEGLFRRILTDRIVRRMR